MMYTKQINPERVESAAVYTYPLKDNVPLIIVENGKVIEPHWFK